MLWKQALHSVGRALHRFSGEAGGPRIGVALGGGFARGVAHIGVLRALERHRIPIHCIAGVSAGSVVAAAYAEPDATRRKVFDQYLVVIDLDTGKEVKRLTLPLKLPRLHDARFVAPAP